VDPDRTAAAVRDTVDGATGRLPADAEVTVLAQNLFRGPDLVIAVPGLETARIDEALDRVRALGGVARCKAEGMRRPELRIELDRSRAAKFGVSTSDLTQALKGVNTMADASELVVRTPTGKSVPVTELARARYSLPSGPFYRLDGRSVVLVFIWLGPDAPGARLRPLILNAMSEHGLRDARFLGTGEKLLIAAMAD
jgi:hypothetical protein